MKFSLLIVLSLLLASTLAGKDVYVDNVKGSDRAAGTASAPVRTIRRGMELLSSGDTLHLTPNAQPYTESIHFSGKNRHLAGKPGAPTIVDGHGARFSGLRHRVASEWTRSASDIYTLQLNNNAWVMDQQGYWSGFPIVFADGKPLPWKKSKAELLPNSYVLTKVFGAKKTAEHNQLHVRLEPGKTPADVKLETPAGDYAVCVEGVDHVTIRNIRAEYYPGDGFDSAWRKVVFEHVEGSRNMDQGISAHASEIIVKHSRFHGNAGGGVVDVGMPSDGKTHRSKVRYIDCIMEDDVFRNDVQFYHTDALLENCIIRVRRGNAITAEKESNVVLKNCILFNLSKPGTNTAVLVSGTASVSMERCTAIGFGTVFAIHEKGRIHSRNNLFLNCNTIVSSFGVGNYTGQANLQTSQHYFFHPLHYRTLDEFRKAKKQDQTSRYDPSATLHPSPDAGADAEMMEKIKTCHSSLRSGK